MALLVGDSISGRREPPMRWGLIWWTSRFREVPQISQRESGATSIATYCSSIAVPRDVVSISTKSGLIINARTRFVNTV